MSEVRADPTGETRPWIVAIDPAGREISVPVVLARQPTYGEATAYLRGFSRGRGKVAGGAIPYVVHEEAFCGRR